MKTKYPYVAYVQLERAAYSVTVGCFTKAEAMKIYDGVRDQPAYIEWLDTTNGRTTTPNSEVPSE